MVKITSHRCGRKKNSTQAPAKDLKKRRRPTGGVSTRTAPPTKEATQHTPPHHQRMSHARRGIGGVWIDPLEGDEGSMGSTHPLPAPQIPRGPGEPTISVPVSTGPDRDGPWARQYPLVHSTRSVHPEPGVLGRSNRGTGTATSEVGVGNLTTRHGHHP